MPASKCLCLLAIAWVGPGDGILAGGRTSRCDGFRSCHRGGSRGRAPRRRAREARPLAGREPSSTGPPRGAKLPLPRIRSGADPLPAKGGEREGGGGEVVAQVLRCSELIAERPGGPISPILVNLRGCEMRDFTRGIRRGFAVARRRRAIAAVGWCERGSLAGVDGGGEAWGRAARHSRRSA